MRKTFTILFIIISFIIKAQDFGKIYGSLQNDDAFSIIANTEGDFFIVGSVRSSKENYEQVRIIKINNNGDVLFNKYYGTGNRNIAYNIILLKDNNLLICGETWGGFGSLWGRRNIFLLKINTEGDEIWSHYYYNYHRDQAFSVKELKSGDFLVVGYSKSFNEAGSLGDVYILKTNSKGQFLWEKSFNDSGNDYGFDIIEKENKNLIILSTSGGFFNSNQFDYRYSHDAEIMLIETNELGEEITRKYWGTNKHDFGRQIISNNYNNGYYIIGSTQSYGNGSFDLLLLQIDNEGNEKWFKTYGKSDFDYGISIDMSKSNDFLFLLGTTYDISSEKTKLFLLKTDLEGNEIWSHEIGNDYNFYGRKVKSLKDGGCIVVGAIQKDKYKTNDIFVQIFDKNGNIKFNINDLTHINVFPNPVKKNNKINFNLSHQYKDEYINLIEIYDINSKLIKKTNFTNNSWTLNTSNLRTGIYFYNIYAKDKKISGKFIVY